MRQFTLFGFVFFGLLLTGCQSPEPVVDQSAAVKQTEQDVAESATELPLDTLESTATAEPEPTLPEATSTMEPEPTIQADEGESELVIENGSLQITHVEEAAPESSLIEPVTFIGAEGLVIHGTQYRFVEGTAAPAVILLHMLNGNQKAWEPLIPALTQAGYAVLTIDMRGHGLTGGDKDWVLAEQDLTMVWDAFTQDLSIDATRTAVIGGSIGSNIALLTAKNRPEILTAVLLSPGLDYRGVTTPDAAGAYGDRPLLIVASEEDGYSADSSRQLDSLASNSTLEMYDGAGHGTNMLGREPALTPLLIKWLDEMVK